MGYDINNFQSKTWNGSEGSKYQCDAFCQVCQYAGEWDDLKFQNSDLGCVNEKETLMLENHNVVVQKLLNIYNAGTKGKRTVPFSDPNDINLQNRYEIYTADMYNNVIQYINSLNTVQKDQTYLRGFYFIDLIDYVNNLSLDSNRCSGNYNTATCISCDSSCESGNCCDGCTSCDTILWDSSCNGNNCAGYMAWV